MKVNIKNGTSIFAAAAFVGTTLFSPIAANADQSSKNQWRNIGIGSAIVAGLGLMNHNSTIAEIGVAGAGYSAYRYEQDRHNQSQDNCGNYGFGNWQNRDGQRDNNARYNQDPGYGDQGQNRDGRNR